MIRIEVNMTVRVNHRMGVTVQVAGFWLMTYDLIVTLGWL